MKQTMSNLPDQIIALGGILIGSRIWGGAHDGSDYDYLVDKQHLPAIRKATKPGILRTKPRNFRLLDDLSADYTKDNYYIKDGSSEINLLCMSGRRLKIWQRGAELMGLLLKDKQFKARVASSRILRISLFERVREIADCEYRSAVH